MKRGFDKRRAAGVLGLALASGAALNVLGWPPQAALSGEEMFDLGNFSAITLQEAHFGYSQFRANDNTSETIDATAASWIVSNHGPDQNTYPFLVDKSIPGARILGGTILGSVPLDLEWRDIYENSAAVMVRDAPRVEIHNWTIRQAWDGIRIAGSSDGFRIENVAMSAIRDDAVENDHGANGTIANSFFDGVFSGVSMSHNALPDLTRNVLILDNVLMRMRSFPFKGETTHQSPFKIEENSPSLKIHNTVIAIENVDHVGRSRLKLAWEKTIESSGNVFLNLSGQPFPDNYPLPADGWTILQGQAAQEHWARARDNWLSANASVDEHGFRRKLMTWDGADTRD